LQMQYDLRKAQLENAHVYQQISLVTWPMRALFWKGWWKSQSKQD
jgi:hypothetical protein